MTQKMKEALDDAAKGLQWSRGQILINKKTLKPADISVTPLEELVSIPIPDEICHAVIFGANWYKNNMWHDRKEEPKDRAHCLIRFSSDIPTYTNFEPTLYIKKERCFLTQSYPHPTGYKVEKHTIDGGIVAEVYKDKRDRISIDDITMWAELEDIIPTIK